MENNDKDFFSDIEMNEPVAEHSENTLQENEMTLNNQNTTSDDEDFNTNETLKLILEIQCSILAFIRKLKENNNL